MISKSLLNIFAGPQCKYFSLIEKKRSRIAIALQLTDLTKTTARLIPSVVNKQADVHLYVFYVNDYLYWQYILHVIHDSICSRYLHVLVKL